MNFSPKQTALLTLTNKFHKDMLDLFQGQDQQDQQDQKDQQDQQDQKDQLRNDLEELLYNKLHDKLYYDLYNNVYDQVESEVHSMLCGRLDHILENLEHTEHTELQKIIVDNIRHQVNEHMKEGITFNLKSIYSNK